MYILGIIAFVLFFLNDFNDYKIGSRLLKVCFPVGVILLIGATVGFVFTGNGKGCENLLVTILIGILCALLLVAEIHSLFFSFDPSEAYDKTEKDRKVYTKKMYALCRHPGVLFFILLYFLLSVITPLPLAAAAMLSGLNLLLAIFEDIVVFPAILGGYYEYKKDTPFIIPNGKAVQKCIGDFRRGR